MSRLGTRQKYTPYIRSGGCTRLFYDFGSHCKPESELEIKPYLKVRTPIWAPHNGIVGNRTCCRARYTEICQLDTSVLVRQNVGSLYVAMDDTLIMQVHQAFQHLRNIDRYQILRKLAKSFTNVMQRSILAEPFFKLELFEI